MHKLGGWDGQYFSYNVCSLALFGFVGKRQNDRGGLDSSSDSRVPIHGVTSVPSMSGFSGNPILLQ